MRSLIGGIAVVLIFLAPAPAGAECVDYEDYLHYDGILSIGVVRRVATSGPYACVTGDDCGFAVLDASSPGHPRLLGTLIGAITNPAGLAVAGTFAYVLENAAGHGTLFVIDFADPANPHVVGSWKSNDPFAGVAVSEKLAFVVGGQSLKVLDITSPEQPVLRGKLNLPGGLSAVTVAGNHVLAMEGYGGDALYVVDVSVPSDPWLASVVPTLLDPVDAAASGSLAYIAESRALEVLDFSDPLDPHIVASLEIAQSIKHVALSGTDVFLLFGGGFQVYDVTDPSNPQRIGSIGFGSSTYDIALSDAFVYVARGGYEPEDGGLLVFDATNPRSPILGAVSFSGRSAVAGNIACIAYNVKLYVVDVSDPRNPEVLADFQDVAAVDVAMTGQYAYVANTGAGLVVVDLADPRNPTIAGSVVTPFDAWRVAVQGSFAYVLGGAFEPSTGYLAVVDVSDPESPWIIGTVNLGAWPADLAVSGDVVYVANVVAGFRVVSVANPYYPVVAYTLSLPDNALSVAVSGGYAYVAASSAGLQVIDVSDLEEGAWIAGAVSTPNARGVAASEATAYVGDNYDGLVVIDVTDVGAMRIIGGAIDGCLGVTVSGDLVLARWDHLYLLPVQCGPTTAVPFPMPEGCATRLRAVPNPAGGKTTIRLALPTSGRVAAAIYNVSGRRVRRLSDEVLAAGPHEVPWDGRDDAGQEVAPGVYLARVSTPEGTHTARVVIIK